MDDLRNVRPHIAETDFIVFVVGIADAEFPFTGTSATIEYRVRCRDIGEQSEWYSTFLSGSFYGDKFSIADALGRRLGTGGAVFQY